MADRSDLLIVGAGPAGLAAAIGARSRSLTVTVIDRSRPPIDKACGEGLMPDGVAALAALGVDREQLDGRPFRGIRYLDAGVGSSGLEAEPVAEGRFPDRPGLGVRRTRLHRALAERAEAVGAHLRWNIPARALVPAAGAAGDGGTFAVRTDGGALTARWIVAADGLASRLRRWAGLGGRLTRRLRFGVRRHFRVAPWETTVDVHWADGCEAYVTPVGDDEVGVAILWGAARHGKTRFDELLDRFPRLRRRLGDAPAISDDAGAGPLARRPRALVRRNLVLLGDAAGYLDAITGEGLSLAFHQARELVAALADDAPTRHAPSRVAARYAAAHRRLRRRPELLIRALLAAERRPWLRRRMIRALAADPDLFSRLLAVHTGDTSLGDFGLGGALRLGWGLASS